MATMSQSRRVYSTDQGRMCPDCSRLLTACRCKKGKSASAGGSLTNRIPQDGIVRVARSTKGRKGKGVTLITGVPLTGDALKKFSKRLKATCGAGGALKDGVIEIQGEHRDRLVPLLEARGWTVKRSGA